MAVFGLGIALMIASTHSLPGISQTLGSVLGRLANMKSAISTSVTLSTD